LLGWGASAFVATHEAQRHHVEENVLFALVALNLPESAVLALLVTLALWAFDKLFALNVPGGLFFLVCAWLAFTALGARRHFRAWQREREEMA
jgi:hypothetical protein